MKGNNICACYAQKLCENGTILCTLLTSILATGTHGLARSLHDVSCANNNRFEVVVCFRLAFHVWENDFFLEISSLKFLKNFVPL